ncbi:hypothetical protein UO65_1045 [Actinokineospora spheciospongiae]|uniref:Uncharacterized protein n=1 Tax=Actinokineospora spheciospongiae TaxID=909613 RepID=W7J3N4_9PSEU|nr:hypothetical protein UO65_1045 [Actinokineospora spheciospongiae]
MGEFPGADQCEPRRGRPHQRRGSRGTGFMAANLPPGTDDPGARRSRSPVRVVTR